MTGSAFTLLLTISISFIDNALPRTSILFSAVLSGTEFGRNSNFQEHVVLVAKAKTSFLKPAVLLFLSSCQCFRGFFFHSLTSISCRDFGAPSCGHCRLVLSHSLSKLRFVPLPPFSLPHGKDWDFFIPLRTKGSSFSEAMATHGFRDVCWPDFNDCLGDFLGKHHRYDACFPLGRDILQQFKMRLTQAGRRACLSTTFTANASACNLSRLQVWHFLCYSCMCVAMLSFKCALPGSIPRILFLNAASDSISRSEVRSSVVLDHGILGRVAKNVLLICKWVYGEAVERQRLCWVLKHRWLPVLLLSGRRSIPVQEPSRYALPLFFHSFFFFFFFFFFWKWGYLRQISRRWGDRVVFQ